MTRTKKGPKRVYVAVRIDGIPVDSVLIDKAEARDFKDGEWYIVEYQRVDPASAKDREIAKRLAIAVQALKTCVEMNDWGASSVAKDALAKIALYEKPAKRRGK